MNTIYKNSTEKEYASCKTTADKIFTKWNHENIKQIKHIFIGFHSYAECKVFSSLKDDIYN